MKNEPIPAPGLNYARPAPIRQQFFSTLGNDAEINAEGISHAVRAVMNGVRSVAESIFRLERQCASAADVLLGRMFESIDFSALDRAREGVERLEVLLGKDGMVLFECADHAVSALRQQVEDAAAMLAPYNELRRKKR